MEEIPKSETNRRLIPSDHARMLRYYRDVAGLSQRDLANQVGATAQTISNTEQNRSVPNTTLVKRIRRWLAQTFNAYTGQGYCDAVDKERERRRIASLVEAWLRPYTCSDDVGEAKVTGGSILSAPLDEAGSRAVQVAVLEPAIADLLVEDAAALLEEVHLVFATSPLPSEIRAAVKAPVLTWHDGLELPDPQSLVRPKSHVDLRRLTNQPRVGLAGLDFAPVLNAFFGWLAGPLGPIGFSLERLLPERRALMVLDVLPVDSPRAAHQRLIGSTRDLVGDVALTVGRTRPIVLSNVRDSLNGRSFTLDELVGRTSSLQICLGADGAPCPTLPESSYVLSAFSQGSEWVDSAVERFGSVVDFERWVAKSCGVQTRDFISQLDGRAPAEARRPIEDVAIWQAEDANLELEDEAQLAEGMVDNGITGFAIQEVQRRSQNDAWRPIVVMVDTRAAAAAELKSMLGQSHFEALARADFREYAELLYTVAGFERSTLVAATGPRPPPSSISDVSSEELIIPIGSHAALGPGAGDARVVVVFGYPEGKAPSEFAALASRFSKTAEELLEHISKAIERNTRRGRRHFLSEHVRRDLLSSLMSATLESPSSREIEREHLETLELVLGAAGVARVPGIFGAARSVAVELSKATKPAYAAAWLLGPEFTLDANEGEHELLVQEVGPKLERELKSGRWLASMRTLMRAFLKSSSVDVDLEWSSKNGQLQPSAADLPSPLPTTPVLRLPPLLEDLGDLVLSVSTSAMGAEVEIAQTRPQGVRRRLARYGLKRRPRSIQPLCLLPHDRDAYLHLIFDRARGSVGRWSVLARDSQALMRRHPRLSLSLQDAFHRGGRFRPGFRRIAEAAAADNPDARRQLIDLVFGEGIHPEQYRLLTELALAFLSPEVDRRTGSMLDRVHGFKRLASRCVIRFADEEERKHPPVAAQAFSANDQLEPLAAFGATCETRAGFDSTQHRASLDAWIDSCLNAWLR